MRNDNGHSQKLPEINADYIDKLLSYQPVRKETESPIPAPVRKETESPAPEPVTEVSATEGRPTKPKKALILIAAVAVLFVIFLLFFLPAPDPYTDISDAQWVAMCRDAYDGLYAQEQLHFTQTTVRSTVTATTNSSVETWFSGENYYRVETDKDGQKTAFLAKDGAFYRNIHQEGAAVGWTPRTESPWSPLSAGAWEEANYTLDGLERKGKEMEVVFSKSADPSTSGKQTRVFYLRFRFDAALELKAIRYSNVVYAGAERDPEQIKSSVSDEYTFHPSTKADIEAAIYTPLKMIAEHNRESQKWSTIAAAVYEELCSRTVLHYTYEQIGQAHSLVLASTMKEEGWICGTDSVTRTKTEKEVKAETGKETRTLETFWLRMGSDSYTKTITNGETDGWTQRSREPYMYSHYGETWNKTLYTFYKEASSETGTDISFYRPSTLPGSDNLISGITTITLHLDKEIDLYKITVSVIDGGLDTEPHTVTQYQLHDVTEAQAREEIDKYYQMATDNS